MVLAKVIRACLSKAQKSQLKELEEEAKRNSKPAKEREPLAILLNDPSIAVQAKCGRKPAKPSSPAKRGQRGAGPVTKAQKQEQVEQAKHCTEGVRPDSNPVQAGKSKKHANGDLTNKAVKHAHIRPTASGWAAGAGLAAAIHGEMMEEIDDNYEEKIRRHFQEDHMAVDDLDFNDTYSGYDEDPSNQSTLQLQSAVASVMDQVDDEESDNEADLSGVLIDYCVLWGGKVIRNTTLAALTPFVQFKKIISKLMGCEEDGEMSLAYQISLAIAKPPASISTALDKAQDYLGMINVYRQRIENHNEKGKKVPTKGKGKSEPKPIQIWIFDTSPKPIEPKGKNTTQGTLKAKSGEEASSNGAGSNLEFMGEVHIHFSCTLHRSGHPCYPTPDRCCHFTAGQLSQWNYLVKVKKLDHLGNLYTAAKVPIELGLTATAVPLSQDYQSLRVPSFQSSSCAMPPQFFTALQACSGPYYGNFGIPPAPSSAINYPKLCDWLKGLDSNPVRVQEDQKFGHEGYILTFKDYSWEKLDDLLDASINAQLLVDVVGKDFAYGPPLKPGSAAALLRWAKQNAKAAEEGASLQLLGDFITTPRWP
ncbi:hypothetical protein FRB90_011414 [Tulasnella sp. 427]|nr:hypothetical protein FRB90_011414 [Tulasnella sp. 427]